jgi:superoxide dismutase, Cu-Zn family
VDHSLPRGNEIVGHTGDLGNLESNSDEVAIINLMNNLDTNKVLGRALIVHEQIDDGGQPTGNAGSRIAQCVLGRTDL